VYKEFETKKNTEKGEVLYEANTESEPVHLEY
jgi:hypothetical protein